MKKYLAIGVVALLLLVMVFLNRDITEAEPGAVLPTPAQTGDAGGASQEASVPVDYFALYRQERESVRTREIGYLDEIIASGAGDGEVLEDAARQKLAIVSNMEAEFTIESLVRAKGFEDAAVSFDQGAVNVVVKAESLSDEDVARILDIVTGETGAQADEVKIMAKRG